MEKEKKFYVYEHVRPDTMECFYVGKGYGKRAYRMSDRNTHHKGITSKYGCITVIVKDNLTEDEAFAYEQELIFDYVFNLGYGIDIDGLNDYNHKEDSYLVNMTLGGEGVYGKKLSKEQVELIRERGKKYVGKLNPNYGNTALKGEKHFMYGKHHSEETKNKISKANKGKKTGSDNPWYGKGYLQMGESNPNYGNKWNDEQIKKASEYWKKHSILVTNNPSKTKVRNVDTGEVFDSITLAKQKYTVGDISACVRGKTKRAGGYRWEYVA